jgi:hypothetical protein
MAVLLELGPVGAIIFLGILISIWRKISLLKRYHSPPADWFSLGACGSFIALMVSLLFINGYTSVHFWLFLGLIIVAGTIHRETPLERVPHMKEQFLTKRNNKNLE